LLGTLPHAVPALNCGPLCVGRRRGIARR
jgi:hypothetical protein